MVEPMTGTASSLALPDLVFQARFPTRKPSYPTLRQGRSRERLATGPGVAGTTGEVHQKQMDMEALGYNPQGFICDG